MPTSTRITTNINTITTTGMNMATGTCIITGTVPPAPTRRA